jgi:NSS family neurotransmitter:Na+ symporter
MAGQNDNWSSRVGFILASMGMAFGAGNIWRFPRVVAANDGGHFSLPSSSLPCLGSSHVDD